MKKCSAAPRVAVAIPPLNDSGPSNPLATDCKTLLGLLPLSNPQARKAWLMSSTPQAKPAQKMARNAREEVAAVVAAVPMNSPSFSGDDDDRTPLELRSPKDSQRCADSDKKARRASSFATGRAGLNSL